MAGADQFAEVEGTGLNPREEAKRCGFFDVLQQMAALAEKKIPKEDDIAVALEDVYRLFEVSRAKKWKPVEITAKIY